MSSFFVSDQSAPETLASGTIASSSRRKVFSSACWRGSARPLHGNVQCGNLVDVAFYERCEAVEKVFGLLPCSIAPRNRNHLIGMMRNRDQYRRTAVRVPIEYAAEAQAVPLDPCRTTVAGGSSRTAAGVFASGVSPTSAW